jgi:hypothetical protein
MQRDDEHIPLSKSRRRLRLPNEEVGGGVKSEPEWGVFVWIGTLEFEVTVYIFVFLPG